ncbi:MAG TPA: hypothetical protein VMU94_06670 [Streptosporangiaceae bacterium]|nr:hypothetical protein [Streptosporangiaceae bacterium]
MPVTARPDDWSPADNPYAIALSETQWSLWTVQGPGTGEEQLRGFFGDSA